MFLESENNDMSNDIMTEVIYKVAEKMTEDQDRFIFEQIRPWCEENTKIVISKRILCRALELYKREHKDEYYELLKEVEDDERRIDN